MILSVAFTIFLITYFTTANIRTVDSIPIGIETIIIFGFISYYFYRYFKKTDNSHIYTDPEFWFVTGLLVYLGSTFFFNILGNIISKQEIKTYWYLTFFGDILKNILATVAIILYAKNPIRKLKKSAPTVPNLDMI